MATIYDLLKEQGFRISSGGDKWLVYDGKWFEVFERKYNAKKTKSICRVTDEDVAVREILRD